MNFISDDFNYQHSVVILVCGDESTVLNHAITVADAILCSYYINDTSLAFLICKREVLDGLNVFDKSIVESFYLNQVPCHGYNEDRGDEIGSRPLEFILNRCFGDGVLRYSHANDDFINIFHDEIDTNSINVDEILTRNDETHEVDVERGNARNEESDGNEYILEDVETPNSTQYTFMNAQIKREKYLKRLLFRFVDDNHLRRLGNPNKLPEDINLDSYSDDYLLWNYIHSTNEISFHDNDISLIIISGLAQMQTSGIMTSIGQQTEDFKKKSIQSSSSLDYSNIFHPFASIKVLDDQDNVVNRVYKNEYITNYALSIANTYNTINIKVNNIELTYKRNKLPMLIIFETLPTDPVDANLFISFLSERFSLIYRIL